MPVNFFFEEQKISSVDEVGIIELRKDELPAFIDYDLNNKQRWDSIVKINKRDDYYFNAIDNHIIVKKKDNENDEESRCDCMLHTDKSICFIEIKHQKHNYISKAISQLEKTIDVFNENHDFNQFDFKVAYICNTRHPLVNTLRSNNCNEFVKKYGVSLHINREIKGLD